MTAYADFLARKQIAIAKPGRAVTPADIHPTLTASGPSPASTGCASTVGAANP